MKALLKPTWQASVEARSAAALISITVASPSAVMVVVRRSALSVKYRISPKHPPGLASSDSSWPMRPLAGLVERLNSLEQDLGALKQRVDRKSEEFAGLLDQALEGE